MHCFLDREALQSLLVALDNLIVEQQVHLRGTHDKAFELDRDLLDLETPVLHGILLGESVDHLLDLSNLLLRRDTGHGESVPHPSTLSDGVRNAIEQAEL